MLHAKSVGILGFPSQQTIANGLKRTGMFQEERFIVEGDEIMHIFLDILRTCFMQNLLEFWDFHVSRLAIGLKMNGMFQEERLIVKGDEIMHIFLENLIFFNKD